METLAKSNKGIRIAIDEFLFLLSWVVKAFYTQKSGGMQLGDYIFVCSFIVFVIEHFNSILNLFGNERYFLIFVCFVFFINLSYAIWYSDSSFLYSIAYFIFNLFVIVEFRCLAKNKKFLQSFFVATFICLVIQIFIFFLGKGKIYGGERYMGTFNDPNQLAFFVMSRFFIIYLICKGVFNKNRIAIIITIFSFFMALFLIVKAASTGMLLGMAIFSLGWLINVCVNNKNGWKYLMIIFAIVFAVIAFFCFGGEELFFNSEFISNRLQQKIEKLFGQSGIDGYIKDRNLGALITKPYYIFFGSGEGGWSRFIEVSAGYGELHSTILGLLFYYGILPYIFIFIWVTKNLKYVKKTEICVYIAVFIEMLTLINHRQASLWILLILPSIMYWFEEVEFDD